MDELESQIRQVLGDPAQMQQIMGLAQSLMGGAAPEEPQPPPPPRAGGGLAEKLGAMMKQPGGQSGQREVLQAIRPFLSEKRQRKVDRALQITRMAHLARLAMDGLGDAEHG